MHLRKAKLMFFWVRYPSSAVLKMYFPDIKFNKNNTAQLVKWFSNFRWVECNVFYFGEFEGIAWANQSLNRCLICSHEIVSHSRNILRVIITRQSCHLTSAVWGGEEPRDWFLVEARHERNLINHFSAPILLDFSARSDLVELFCAACVITGFSFRVFSPGLWHRRHLSTLF